MSKTHTRLLTRALRRTGNELVTKGRTGTGATLLSLAGRTASHLGTKADLLGQAARLSLESGREPYRSKDAYAAELVRADRLFAAGKTTEATRSMSAALLLAFHRVLHVDRLTSPLADDPTGFTAPLRESALARAVAAPRGRRVSASSRPKDRPLRLLFVTYGNANFLRHIVERYETHPDTEVRVLDLGKDPVLSPLARGLQRMMDRALGARTGYGAEIEVALRPHLDWADTMFVDWCTGAAAFVTLVDPGSTRIIVRLHSFEAFSYWPHIIDFSRVDDVVFVSEHLRDFTTAVVPRLLDADAPRLHVVSNAMDLRAVAGAKSAEARFTLGLVGVAQIAKDPLWAIDLLERLHAQDDRYRLVIVGSGLNPHASVSVQRYHDELERRLAPLEARGVVTRLGQIDDVAAALTDVGVIISCSVRESFHAGFAEGAASGAVPVARDWPFFAGRRSGGARTLFPADWVVSTPAEAARRVIALTAAEEVWRKAGAEAADHAIATWDWSGVRAHFDRLLLPEDGPYARTSEL